MGAKKKSKANKLSRMSEEEKIRYLQHRAAIEEEAKRRKQQLISTFLKVCVRAKKAPNTITKKKKKPLNFFFFLAKFNYWRDSKYANRITWVEYEPSLTF